MNPAVVSALVSVGMNECLGISDSCANWIIRWAARRWEARSGTDHLAEWQEDLAHVPSHLLKLLSASWLLLSTFVGEHRLTLNLPSLWRLSRPLRAALSDVSQVVRELWHDLAQQKGSSHPTTVRRLHAFCISTAVALLPRRVRARYREEWLGELQQMSEQERTRFTMGLAMVSPLLAIRMRSQ